MRTLVWIGERRLRPRTVELYRWLLLRRYLTAGFGDLSLRSIDKQTVRLWRSELLKEGTSPIMAANAYRPLGAVMATAADDEIVPRNPCRIRGADREESPERPVLGAAQVNALASLVPDRFQALVLLATFAGLRWER